MTSAPGSAAALKRELLVRHLEAWAPAALHSDRRVTYVHGWADLDPAAAEAALNVFADLSDLVRGRELSMVAVAADPVTVSGRLALPGGPAGLAVVRRLAGVRLTGGRPSRR